MWMDGGGMMMMAAMSLLTIALIAAAVAAVVWAIRSTARPAGTTDQHEAEQILRRRYASGDIDDEEYQRRLAVLRSGRASPS